MKRPYTTMRGALATLAASLTLGTLAQQQEAAIPSSNKADRLHPAAQVKGAAPKVKLTAAAAHHAGLVQKAPFLRSTANTVRAVAARQQAHGIGEFRGGGYCTASAEGSVDFGLDERIVGVSFANINNTSPDVAPTPPAYTFYPTPVGNVTRGTTYAISVDVAREGATNSYSENQAKVWIDYNQDFDFDDLGEEVFVSVIGSVEAYTGNITIPVGAALGSTRMRVRMYDTHDGSVYINVFNDTPCGAASYGEIEDYTLNIGEAGPTPPNDLCASVTATPLSINGNITFNGDNTGATIANDYAVGSDLEAIGLPSVWHAFTITECADVTVSYCGTTPAFLDFWIVLTTDCPGSDLVFNTSYNTIDCGDENATIYYEDLPAGTYYLPVLLDTDPEFLAQGPYTIDVSAAACGGGGTGPVNDACGDVSAVALAVPGTTTFTGDNTNATETGDFEAGSGLEGFGPVVWHAITTTACSNISVAYCGTAGVFQNVAAFLAAGCPATDADYILYTDGNFDDCGDGNATLFFTNVPAGTWYIPVLWDPAAPAEGPYTLEVSTTACGGGTGPANDACGDVTSVNLAVPGTITLEGDNTDATEDGDFEVGSGLEGFGPVVWHAITTTTCADITLAYCGTAGVFQNVAAFLAASCPATDADYVLFSGGNFDDCGDGNATIFFTAVPAGTWYVPVLWDPAAPAEGPYTIEVSTVPCAAAPANDPCEGAIVLDVNLTCEPTAGDVTGATQSLPALECNGFLGNANDDVWYAFVATSPNATITVVGADTLDAVIELFEGSCGSLNSLDCSDATIGGGTEEIVSNSLTVGNTYYVRVYDWYNGYPEASTFTICVVGDVGTTVGELSQGVLGVRPNPTQGDVTIELPGDLGQGTIEVHDMTGRLVHSQSVNAGPARAIHMPLTGKLTAGAYTVRLITAGVTLEQRLVVR